MTTFGEKGTGLKTYFIHTHIKMFLPQIFTSQRQIFILPLNVSKNIFMADVSGYV